MHGHILRRSGPEIELEIRGISARIFDALRFGPLPITVDSKPYSVHAISIVNLGMVLVCCSDSATTNEQETTMKYNVRFDGSSRVGVHVEACSVDEALSKAVELCVASDPNFAGLKTVPDGAPRTIGALVCDDVTGAKEFRQITIARKITVEMTRPKDYYVYYEDSLGVLHIGRVSACSPETAAETRAVSMGYPAPRDMTVVDLDGKCHDFKLQVIYRACKVSR